MNALEIYDAMMQENSKLLSLTLLTSKGQALEMDGISLILGDIHDNLRDRLIDFEHAVLSPESVKGGVA